jgi:hypothetical protein
MIQIPLLELVYLDHCYLDNIFNYTKVYMLTVDDEIKDELEKHEKDVEDIKNEMTGNCICRGYGYDDDDYRSCCPTCCDNCYQTMVDRIEEYNNF